MPLKTIALSIPVALVKGYPSSSKNQLRGVGCELDRSKQQAVSLKFRSELTVRERLGSYHTDCRSY
jgi:hypothetical protein